MIHVLPIKDKRPHERSTMCPCEPTLDTEQPEMQVVHNAFDRRERLEEFDGKPHGGWVCSSDCSECDGPDVPGSYPGSSACSVCHGTGEAALEEPCLRCGNRAYHTDLQRDVAVCHNCWHEE